jgi:hypothetical protein
MKIPAPDCPGPRTAGAPAPFRCPRRADHQPERAGAKRPDAVTVRLYVSGPRAREVHVAGVEHHLEVVGDLGSAVEALIAVLHPAVRMVEHPDAMNPRGAVRNRDAAVARFTAGKRLLAAQTIELYKILVSDNRGRDTRDVARGPSMKGSRRCRPAQTGRAHRWRAHGRRWPDPRTAFDFCELWSPPESWQPVSP